jgi:hypothetical protein
LTVHLLISVRDRDAGGLAGDPVITRNVRSDPASTAAVAYVRSSGVGKDMKKP